MADDPKIRIIEVSGVAHQVSHMGLAPRPARPEDGAMKFGDDWPGLFTRGDSAEIYKGALDSALSAMEAGRVPPMHTVELLRELQEALGLPTSKDAVTQLLKEFDACKG